MGTKGFHDKPYDSGTLAKLRVFELYAQEWIPVFLSRPQPLFEEVHLFDFFSGPGKDSAGIYGSPLRIVDQLRRYHRMGIAGWNKVRIVVHLFDEDHRKVALLKPTFESSEWDVPGVQIDCRSLIFQDALQEHEKLLCESRIAKLLIIDQFGVDEVSDSVFRRLISYPTTDFIFFLSSSTLHRFRAHPAIKQKIEKPEDSYDVHRAAVGYYRNLIPADTEFYLGSFSIRKRSNIYGLIFGSRHPLGIHKFLRVAWSNDEIAGEANFDIDRENVSPDEGILSLDVMRPKKVQAFEAELESSLRSGGMQSEADVVRFCIEKGMTCQHAAPILKKLKSEGIIEADFRVPDVQKMNSPRTIQLIS
jgi:three-Cys-motif partner protein